MYKLNFPDKFYQHPGDKYLDGKVLEHPITVYQALLIEKNQFPENWKRILKESDSKNLEEVLNLIQRKTICTDYSSNPVEIWIGEQGNVRIAVYDG